MFASDSVSVAIILYSNSKIPRKIRYKICNSKSKNKSEKIFPKKNYRYPKD